MAAESVVEKSVEVVADGVEVVADNLDTVAEATRQINGALIAYFGGGVGVGVVLGFYFGYKFNREKIKTEAFKKSEAEIEEMRDFYQQKLAATQAQNKPSVEEIIAERGYSTAADADPRPSPARMLRPPVPVHEATAPTEVPVVPVMVQPIVAEPATAASVHTVIQSDPLPTPSEWNWPKELESRDPEKPYVIHEDEYRNNEPDYSQVTLTYYAEDDVLVDDDDKPLPHADLIVGQDNLKFGHGTDDSDVVFVRNDKLSQDMEITRINRSYEQEVLGLQHSATSERMRRRYDRRDDHDTKRT